MFRSGTLLVECSFEKFLYHLIIESSSEVRNLLTALSLDNVREAVNKLRNIFTDFVEVKVFYVAGALKGSLDVGAR